MADAAPAAAPCELPGAPLVRASIEATAAAANMALEGGQEPRVLTISASGEWFEERAGQLHCGRLADEDRIHLQDSLARLDDISVTRVEIRCQALPMRRFAVSTAGGDASWESPCGAEVPSPDALALHRELMGIELP
jgi:hypothetical protein